MGRAATSFRLQCVDSGTSARRGELQTPHGIVATPAFMPVATQGAIKGLTIDQVRSTGASIVLGNTYHLSLRPGAEIVRELGGLHAMMGWDGPILTDSGGFQIFSLASMTKVSEEGAVFRSHIDGSIVELSPERAVEIQEALGSDIAMVLDHVLPLPAEPQAIRDACDRTIRWADRCRQAARRDDQSLFAIVQGGLDADLRRWCADQLAAMDFPGYAIGGLSVGETPDEMNAIVEATAPILPPDRPRYLMGVGRPEDILAAISRGVDMFDCVMPTRNGRNAWAFTDRGPLRMRNQRHRSDREPIETGCPCLACRHSRGYIRHLFQADEMLGPILVTHHNLTYYQRLVAESRDAIAANRFAEFHREKLAGWQRGERAALDADHNDSASVDASDE